MIVVAILASVALGGFNVSFEAMQPKLSKLNPIKGMKRVFSAKGLMELLKSMGKFLLVGAAPNAIAYDSKQFTTGEFFLYGVPASIILMLVTGFAVYVLWPLMGMPILIP